MRDPAGRPATRARPATRRSCRIAGGGGRCCRLPAAAPAAAPGSARTLLLAAGLALAVVAARASSVWELAALSWLVLLAVPLAFIDVAVRRLPDPLTAAAFAGTLALLAITALTGHQPGHLGRAAIGAVALACFYGPGGHPARRPGPGDAKLASSTGTALGWISWQALHRATHTSQLPLGPFILLGTLSAIALYYCRLCPVASLI